MAGRFMKCNAYCTGVVRVRMCLRIGAVDGSNKRHSRYAGPDLYYYSNGVFKLKQTLA